MRIFLGLVLTLTSWLASASPALAPDALRFRHVNAAYPHFSELVWNIAQDRQGQMWFAGQDGVRRFDGHRLKHYRRTDTGAGPLAHNVVRGLLAAPDGTVWFGTRAGLQHFDPASDSFVTHRPASKAPNSPALYARAIIADGAGGLWLGTAEGVEHFDPRTERFTHLKLEQEIAPARTNTIVDLVRDPRGYLWIARLSEVIRFETKTGAIRRYPLNRCHTPQADPRSTQSRKLLLDGGTLWVATTTGLERWNIADAEAPCLNLGAAARLAGVHVVTMAPDREHDIWMSVDGEGLIRWRRADGGIDAFPRKEGDPYSIGDNLIQALEQDSSGTLWIGTLTTGVYHVDLLSGGFRRLTEKGAPGKRLSSSRMTTMGRLRDGRIWFGTLEAGVNFYNPGTGAVTVLQPQPAATVAKLANGGVFGLVQDRLDRLWMATEVGLYRHDLRTGRSTGPRLLTDAVHGTNLLSLHSDPAGHIWAPTRDGLKRFDPVGDSVTAYRHDPANPASLPNNRVGRILHDRQGREWVATPDLLSVLDPATGKFLHVRHPRFSETINELFEDRRGDVWVALPSGLVQVRRKGAGFDTVFHPQPAEVDSVLEADDGVLWMGTEAGLAEYDPRTKRTVEYTANDGIADGTSRPESALRTGDGTMYIGSFRGGVTVFHPAAIRRNPVPPRVAITGFMIDKRPLHASAAPPGVRLEGAPHGVRRLTLSHRQSTLAIEFSAMHYADPDRNTYVYRLEGYDTEWNRTTAADPSALYGTLPPGEYRFQVVAANKNGVQGPPASLLIEVTPAFWAAPWFRLLCTLLLLTLLWVAYRVRVRMLIRKQAQLERTVQSRTAQAQQALQQLKETQQQLVFREKMASVGTLTAGIAHEINNPANFAHAGAQLLGDEQQHFRTVLRALAGDDTDAAVVREIESHFTNLFNRTGTIVEGTTRIRDLVKDLRTFARLDEAEKKEVDLIASLESTIRLVRAKYERIAAIVTDFQTKPRLECWPAQLNQVFMNLIVNACQAIEERHQKDGKAPPGKLAIRSREDGDSCVIEFEDNGCGMAPEVLERVFEPFYTTKDVGSGTGLGLSISFGIVARHNGAITARSEAGVGSCFTVRLPLRGLPARPDPV
ncbi:MAG TPA: two-component regulator propeller domain-containing protein [Burkholderiaceae bacterium]